MYSLLRSVADSFSSSSSSNFPSYSSPRESASVFADYLRSHFSASLSKALPTQPETTFPTTCFEESHSFFCSPFSHAEFLAAATNLSLSTATGPEKVALPMLKHLPLAWTFSYTYLIFPSFCIPFFPSKSHLLLLPSISTKASQLSTIAFFRPISLTSYVPHLFERIIILSRLPFFLKSNSILSPRPGRFPCCKVYTGSNSVRLSVHFEWVWQAQARLSDDSCF